MLKAFLQPAPAGSFSRLGLMGSVHQTRSHKKQADHQIQDPDPPHPGLGVRAGLFTCNNAMVGPGLRRVGFLYIHCLILCKNASISRTYVRVCDRNASIPFVGIIYVSMYTGYMPIPRSRLESQPNQFSMASSLLLWYLPSCVVPHHNIVQ